MTTAEFIPEAFRAATGKLPTFTSGSTKWNNLVASANFYIRQWAREPGVDWNSLYDPAFSLGTVSATDTFDLDDDIRKVSQQEGDFLRILHTSGTTYSDYSLIDANRLREFAYGSYAAQVGRTIKFNAAFTASSQQFGGTIYLPAYLNPEPISGDNDDIPVDDPNWLIFVVAADYVRNDITRKDLRADLINEANQCMERMRQDNDSQISTPFAGWNPTGHIPTNNPWGEQ